MCGSGKNKRVTVSIHFPHGQECRPLQMWGGNGSRQWWIRWGVKAACGRRAIALGAPPAWSAASGRRHVLVVSFAWFICCESTCWRIREWGCCSRTPPPTLIQFILLSGREKKLYVVYDWWGPEKRDWQHPLPARTRVTDSVYLYSAKNKSSFRTMLTVLSREARHHH